MATTINKNNKKKVQLDNPTANQLKAMDLKYKDRQNKRKHDEELARIQMITEDNEAKNYLKELQEKNKQLQENNRHIEVSRSQDIEEKKQDDTFTLDKEKQELDWIERMYPKVEGFAKYKIDCFRSMLDYYVEDYNAQINYINEEIKELENKKEKAIENGDRFIGRDYERQIKRKENKKTDLETVKENLKNRVFDAIKSTIPSIGETPATLLSNNTVLLETNNN